MSLKPLARFRQATFFAAVVVLIEAVVRTVPREVFKQAMSVLASAVWGS